MRENDESFYGIKRRYSQMHDQYFQVTTLDPEFQKRADAVVAESIRQQQEIDAQEEIDFDVFLAEYLAQ